MKVDLDQAEADDEFAADVCIIGAGVAGLTLANALTGSGLRVALLEGGCLLPEDRSQELYNVEMIGHPHEGATKGRFRLFGGSSTQWGGQLLPYPPDIFNPPAPTEMPTWPVKESEVKPYYPAVLRLLGVPEEEFTAGSISSGGAAIFQGGDVQCDFLVGHLSANEIWRAQQVSGLWDATM